MNATTIYESAETSFEIPKESAESIGMIIAGVAAAVVSIVYALRHLKTSQCCGFSCTQVVTDAPPPVVVCPDGKEAKPLQSTDV